MLSTCCFSWISLLPTCLQLHYSPSMYTALILIPASTLMWNNRTFYSDFSELPSQAQIQQDWDQSKIQQDGHKKHCCFFVPESQLTLVHLIWCHKGLKSMQVPVLSSFSCTECCFKNSPCLPAIRLVKLSQIDIEFFLRLEWFRVHLMPTSQTTHPLRWEVYLQLY